jgi:hypothetical protein
MFLYSAGGLENQDEDVLKEIFITNEMKQSGQTGLLQTSSRNADGITALEIAFI